jgi:hypothetical protein
VWIPWRCYIWSTWIEQAARASQEGREQLHCLLPSTRSSTSRRFRCICASSGNPVISDSSRSCFAGKILFCASVATPFPFSCLLANRFFLELHTTTQTLATCTHTHSYEYLYANPTPMSTSEGLEIPEVTNGASSSTGTSLTT